MGKELSTYAGRLTADENRKGVLDVDTVKGCALGMAAHPCGGCYGVCYAAKVARFYGFDFAASVSRQPQQADESAIEATVKRHGATWFRVGTMGDPSHDWALTAYVCQWLSRFKVPVVVTKHWREVPAFALATMARCGVVFNTSVSALDTESEVDRRIWQFYRIARAGCRSFLRVVTAKYGATDTGRWLNERQKWIMMHGHIIDTPLRIPATDSRVVSGDIITEKRHDIATKSTVSLLCEGTYMGHCSKCPDQCGVSI